ncbi:MAG: Ig-like domain-containing protein [candidate division KSB1 bacterium]|nr:Ig-like domain-containing protein [candidate division KSB1 bacterium]MDZ7368445.1 Ig-like domain-containing protein [candidate division KSB1 bacterium]MDZ7406171.1 Ig-like domain-containing protein [candidate division KSB1 bacterium]
MRNRVLITSLMSLLSVGALLAQPEKFSLPKTSSLTKAFRPNAGKAENLETMRRTLGLAPHLKLEWIPGTAGLDTLSVLDDFNRPEIGDEWAIEPYYWEIKDGELVLNSEAVSEWRYLATYLPIHNNLERRIYSVSYRWGRKADALGIREGAHAIMLDRPSHISTGYWIWHRTNWEQVWLWVIRDGTYEDTPGQGREIDQANAQTHNPVAGDVVTVVIRPEKKANYFDYYINKRFDATVEDPNKEFPTNQSITWYVGLFIHGQNLNNQVDDFKVTWLQGDGFTPAAVADLRVTKVTAASVTLEWTAPGDNGFEGRAKQYDIRYSTRRILTDADFNAAEKVPDPIEPGNGGSAERLIIGGLESGKTYYFAMKTSDEAGNVSELSNEVSARVPALLPFSDNFNRANGGLGSAWGGDLANIQIRSNTAQNLAALNGWSGVIYQNTRNVVEASVRYAPTATLDGVSASGILMMAPSPSGSLNGYLLQHDNGDDPSSIDDDRTRLWLVQNGRVDQLIEEGRSRCGFSPRGGNKITVRVIDLEQRYFYVYVEGVFDRVLTDPRNTYNGLYAGFMLQNGLGDRNAIDEFTCSAAPGKPKALSLISGDGQFGEIGKMLPLPLTAALIDTFNNPLVGAQVRFAVTAGSALIPLPPSPDGNLRLEAEDAEITAPIVKLKDANAAAGEYITYPVGKTEDASATFIFEIKQPGNYRVWTRSMKTGTAPGSWRIQIDNGPSFVYDVFQGRTRSSWGWDEMSERGSGDAANPQFDPKIINFTAGEHKIVFHARYEDTRLDKIILSRDSEFVPEDKEESGFLTDFNGYASTNLKLGMTLQPVTIEARHANLKPVTFRITPISNEKPQTINAVAGMSQSGPAGQQLQPFKIVLKDKNGNAVAGQPVAWVVTTGNGTLSQYLSSTGLDGSAETVLTLGNSAATNTVEARANLLSGAGKVVFTAMTISGLASKVAITSGPGQSATVRATLPQPLLVKVTSSTGQGIPNFPVEFKVIRGGGSLNPNSAINNGSFEDGSTVPANWNLEGGPVGAEVSLITNGAYSGAKSLQVNANRDGVGVSQALNYPAAGNYTLSFYAKVNSGTARVLWRLNQAGGTPVDKIIDLTPLATGSAWTPYVITANIGAAGTRVLSIKTLNGGNFQIDDVTISRNTDSNGQISVNWTLGDTAMTQVVRAEAKAGNTALAGSPITFSTVASAGPARKVVAFSGNNQNGSPGQALGLPLVARVTDDYVNGIANRTVTFTVKSGDASFGNNSLSFTTTSDVNGFAPATLKLGATAKGTVLVEAASAGLQSATFNVVVAVPNLVTKVSGAPTLGSAGVRLKAPLVVRVADAQGKAISGYPVNFFIRQGNGRINGGPQAAIVTDANGEAKAYPELGTTPGGLNRIEASITYNNQTLPSQPIVFLIRAAGLKEMTAVSGSGQIGNTCEPLAQPFKIKIIDSLNAGVGGQAVKFTVTAGGGNFNGATAKEFFTDSLGIAAATLTLGDKAVVNQATASLASFLKGSPQTFNATARLGSASVLRKFSGDSLSGAANAVLASPVVVRVTDKCATNGFANIPVTFIVKAGGGKVNGKDTVVVMTNTEGKAQVSWQLGPLAGKFNNKLEARAAINNTPLSNSPAAFVASATASAARSMSIQAGNKQNGRAGETLPNPLVVRVIDGSNNLGNPVPGHRVRFFVMRGGGQFSTGSKDTTVITGANGEAKVFWTLGGAVGTEAQEVRAIGTNNSGGNLENSPLIFTANVNGSDPSAASSVFQVVSPKPPVLADGVTKCKVTVFVRDRFGNPVSGLAVTFMVSNGPNSIEQPSGLTNANGAATCAFSSTRAGMKTVTAKIIGGIDLDRGIDVLFAPNEARNVSLVTGNNQACNVQAATPKPLTVKIGDQFNNGVPNYEVRFTVKGEGRILESGPIKTDEQGQANATYIAGPNTGQMQVWAEAPGLANSPVIFIVTVTKNAAQRLQEISGNGQSGLVNQVLPAPLVVRVMDGFGRAVFGAPVKITVTFGGGLVENQNSVTLKSNELGEVRPNWRLGPAAGVNTLRVEAEGLAGSPIDFRAESRADVAAVLQGMNCDRVSGPVGGNTSEPLTVRVTDFSGNGVDDVEVLFELLQGSGSFSSRDQVRVVQVTSKNGGLAWTPITLGSEAGYRLVRISSEGLRGSPMLCRVYGRALASQTMEAIERTNNQRGTKGLPLNFPLQVLVKDRLGNPVPNEIINFLITAGGGDFNGANPVAVPTDSNGIASAPLTLGKFASANEVTVVRNGLLPSTIVFKATGFDNHFPIIVDLPDRRVTEGDVIEFAVSATDADRDPITYGAKNLPAGAEFDSLNTRVFRWATNLNSAGRYEVSFFARDNKGGVDEEIVVIEVKNRNQRPEIRSRIPVGNLPSKIDTTLEYVNGVGTMLMRVNATDPDGDPLSYRWFVNGKYAGSATNTFFFKSAARWSTVEALVFDQQDTARTLWTVKVPVELSSFSATLESQAGVGAKRVVLRWITGSETNNFGFNVLRSRVSSGQYEKLNRDLIPPRHDGQYVFVDAGVEAGARYYYKLQDIDLRGNLTEHGPINIEVAAPQAFVLQQNYPNPFNPTTQIRYELPRAVHVSVIIYNSLGQEIRRLVDRVQPAGYHHVTWNGRDQRGKPVPSGIYHYRLQVGNEFVLTKKMLLAK